MATITTPAAGVSPYQEAAAAPTVLRAASDGSTVVANDTAVTATTVTALAATNANTLVVVSGQAALNSLITTSQPGVFDGANVTINLEEQNFTTTNQVTSTINSPSGGVGEIQYNSGANSFASDAYFTYTSGNVVTPGIRTNGYFYGNGAPFLAGGNAAIGNFVFSGDTMSISDDANISLTIQGNSLGNNLNQIIINPTSVDLYAFNSNPYSYAELYLDNGNTEAPIAQIIIDGNSTPTQTWTFDSNGNTTFPTGGTISNYPGGTGVNTDSWFVTPNNGTGGVSSQDGQQYIQINDDLFVEIGTSYGTANASAWTFGTDGNVTIPGNIVGAATIAIDNRDSGTTADIQLYSADDILIQARDRAIGSTAEGGDINIYAGNSAEDGDTSAGDIVIEAGRGGASNVDYGGAGGFVRIDAGDGGEAIGASFSARPGGDLTLRAGDAGDNNGNIDLGNTGGNITMQAGDSTGNGIPGGSVYIRSGNGDPSAEGGPDGDVVIQAGSIGSIWTFGGTGNLTLPSNTFDVNYANGTPVSIGGGANTGNVTFDNINIIGDGNLHLQPDSANAGAYLNIYLTAGPGPDIHIAGNGETVILGTDNLANVAVNVDGNVSIQASNGTPHTWTFGTDGMTSFPVIDGDKTLWGAVDDDFNIITTRTDPGTDADIEIQAADDVRLIALGDDAEIYANNSVNIYTNFPYNGVPVGEHQWSFGQDGGLTFPRDAVANTDPILTIVGGANPTITSTDASLAGPANLAMSVDYLNISGFNGNKIVAYPELGALAADANMVLLTNFADQANISAWTFDTTGNLTLPTSGHIIVSGGIVGSGASPAPSINGFGSISGITVSASGNITGAYLFGNGSQLTGITASVPSQTILPTIQTITVSDTSGVGNAGGGGSAFANVTVSNTIPVTEYGVIITDGTTSEKYKTGSLGSIPGTVKLNFTTGLNSAQFTVFAYVTSNAGTSYSNSATGTSGICLLAGTQIALSDGTRKAIEHITYSDKMLSWDFDRGCYAETTAVWIKRSETGSQYNLLTFSDGTTLRTFDQHRIFNKQAGAFTYPMTDATPVGTVTVNEHGQEITLTNKQVIVDTIEYYNVITDHHMNLFSDTVLTSCRFNNIYPITDMKFVKDGRTLRTRAEFENVEDRFFHGLRLAEQTADIETVEWYVNRLLSTEVSTHAELAV